ncbi:hypothetical protein Clacol_000358 [Clathrus columnatus]|uniref:Tyrosine specific protein phosphatases domain-containing protein n=1 Tax=Clathrus columnatus TaxID=1419009 RepID=A0AAV4ZYW1_9AGAM|nr:hypothetical protein Clacol_000358 [Clathrus columnatus]
MSQVLIAPPMSAAMTMTFKEFPPRNLPSPTPQFNEQVPSGERILVSQLAHLASQHHTSEYNRLKFGPGGCSMTYTPLSICAPQHVRCVAMRQLQTLNRQLWWPAGNTINQTSSENPTDQFSARKQARLSNNAPQDFDFLDFPPPDRVLPSLNHPLTVNLQEELTMAISSPLSIIDITPPNQSNLIFATKTSKSHPINISPIVPFELLPLITSHLVPSPPQTSYMFNLPPSLLLNYLVSHVLPSDTPRSYPLMRVHNSNLQIPTNGPGPPESHHTTAISPCESPQAKVTSPANADCINSTKPLLPPLDFPDVLFDTHPLRERPHSAPPSLSQPKSILEGLTMSPPAITELISAMSSNIVNTSGKEIGKGVQKHDFSLPLLPALGNILLSSCPGKKVRLTGPVKGRGAICRDLEQDLQRIKAIGVGCIVCCLDDDELEYLGASWTKYRTTAHALGLDILRIPMPEGFSPMSPAILDQQLSYAIDSYTLKGIPILVHCRGGVGRAGLVACCWLLKLGLCGWISDPDDQSSAYENGVITKVRKDTLMMVERAISVVRRRRSVKAIETYEQVKFLVEFVEFMRLGGRRV